MKKIMVFCILLLISQNSLMAQKYYQERIYEPVIIPAGSEAVAAIYDAPVKDLFLYAYDERSGTLRMIPFQFDEKERGYDPINQQIKRWFYFLPEEGLVTDDGVITEHDGRYNKNDELVFMLKDMGDDAPSTVWIDNEESHNYPRLRLVVCDPSIPNRDAYVFVFRSSTITDPVPHPYNFSFDVPTQTVTCSNYSVGMNTQTGILENITIYPPLGSGVDILDTEKFRYGGSIDAPSFNIVTGRGGKPYANEHDFIYLYKQGDEGLGGKDMFWMKVTQDPVVRVIREVRETISIPTLKIPIDEFAFYVTTKFYPYCGILEGGLKLDDATLAAAFPNADIPPHFECDLLRQSWDFNENIIGAKFYNKYNDGILIDGNPDNINKTFDLPISEWTLTSGPQGSFFTYLTLPDTTWDMEKSGVYFYDNKNGGNADGTTVLNGVDTGDQKSYGDQGLLLINGASLELTFTAYFLPSTFAKADAEKLAQWIQVPSAYFTSVKQHSETPVQFVLQQNYPNPFNQSTSMDVQLPAAAFMSLTILDVNGRTIATLARDRFQQGLHHFCWDGCDQNGIAVPSGIYFYEAKTDNYRDVRKMVLVR